MKPLLIVLPILLIGGTIGAAYMGVINVPGVTPKEKPQSLAESEEETTEPEGSTASEVVEDYQTASSPQTTQNSTGQTEQAQPSPNQEAGAQALAKYWDEIATQSLVPITDTYREEELAQVLFFMKRAKVAELLSTLAPDRAAKLSRELQRLASLQPKTD